MPANIIVTREDFIKMLDKKVQSVYGVSYHDLPDIITIDEYWFEGIHLHDAEEAIDNIMDIYTDNLD